MTNGNALHRGVHFRSTLQANWAATLDSLDIHWQIAPNPILCGFYLPTQNVWAQLDDVEPVLETDGFLDLPAIHQPLTVILRPADSCGMATWQGVSDKQDIILAHCPQCEAYAFMDVNGVQACRRCHYGGHPDRHDATFWQRDHLRSGELIFLHATD